VKQIKCYYGVIQPVTSTNSRNKQLFSEHATGLMCLTRRTLNRGIGELGKTIKNTSPCCRPNV